MTLKETDNHSAQAIFESLMLDPDLEISEGQTREEAAKNEAEYRARQHFNNMRALSLGTEESSVKSLLDFVSRPSSIWSTMIDIMKASLSSVTSGSFYSNNIPESQKLHPHAVSSTSLSDEGNKFIEFLKQNNMPAASVTYVTSLAKAWRETALGSGEDEDGWIKHVSASIGAHDELGNKLQEPNNGGFSAKNQKELSKALHENGYHAHAPAPKAKTINQKWFDGERYGSNTKDDLEQTATLDNLNAALQKMGRKEKVEFGGSNKLKFDENTGNVQQWKAYKEAPDNMKRVHTRISKGQIHKGAGMEDNISTGEIENYSVAEILRGLFHHVDMDGGQHDVTPGEAVQNNAKEEATQEKLEAYDAAEEQKVSNETAEGNLEPITDDELDKIMHQFQVSKNAEEIDKSLPFKLMWHGQMTTPDDEAMHGLAQEFSLVNDDGLVTAEHAQGIHDAIKSGALKTGHIMKGFPKKKNPDGTDSIYPDKSKGPTHYVLKSANKGGESGVHAYVNHTKAKPVVPTKTAKKIAENSTAEEGQGKPVTLNEVADMAEENNEDFPVKNHVNNDTNMHQTMSAAVEGLFSEMTNAYMHTTFNKATDSYSSLSSTGLSVGGLYDRFWSKGSIGLGSTLSQALAARLQLNPHLIAACPGLINNSKFINHEDLSNSEFLSPEIQQHVKDIQGLHAMAAVLNDADKIKHLQDAGTLGAVIKATMEQVHQVINNPNIPALANMNPTYLTHSLEENYENFSVVLENSFGGPQEMGNSLKVIASKFGDLDGGASLAKQFGSELNDYASANMEGMDIYEDINDLHNEIDKAYKGAAQFADGSTSEEKSSLHISGPTHVEMMNHVDNYIESASTSQGFTESMKAAIDGIKETLGAELNSMSAQPLSLKDKQQIFHNMHTALDAGLIDHNLFNEDFSQVSPEDKHHLNGLHNMLDNTYNQAMGDPMSTGDWDAIKGYHAAKSVFESKLSGQPINSMGALNLDDSAVDYLHNLGGSLAAYQGEEGMTEFIDHPQLANNIQMFMGDLLNEYSPEELKQLSPEVDMLHEHLEHSAYNPAAKKEDTPAYKYAKEHSGPMAEQIKNDHETNIANLADAAVNVGKLAASPFPQQGIEQHHQDALDSLQNGILDAVDAGTMTQEQGQQIAIDAGIPEKHFTGSGAVDEPGMANLYPTADFADTKEVNLEPDNASEAHTSIEDAAHNLNIAMKSKNGDAVKVASDMLSEVEDAAYEHGLYGDAYDDIVGTQLTDDAYNHHVSNVPLDDSFTFEDTSETEEEDDIDFGDASDLDDEEYEDEDVDPQWDAAAKNSAEHDAAQNSGWDGEEHDEADFHSETGELQVPGKNANDVREWAKGLEEKHNIDLLGGPTGNEPHDDIFEHFGIEGGHMGNEKISAQHIADYVKEKTGEDVSFTGAEKSEEPKSEPKVEEELDKVPDADASQEKQKQEIMQEIFNDDFKDSDDAKTYKAYLDKQKPEKIDALHETHVIGNLVKKNIKAKATKANQKIQDEKAQEKASEKEEADQVKAAEKEEKEDEKAQQKEADTVPHKAGEIEKKVKEGQNPKQMARDNMVHQHQHGDKMSAKATKEHTDAFHKFEAAGVDMDELLDEKDEHGDGYGSEEHLQAAMKGDAKDEELSENYNNHIESDDHEHVKNREKAFQSGEPGKFTTFDKKGNPNKDLHHTKDKFGVSSLDEHKHGEGPEAQKEEHQLHHNLTDEDKEAIKTLKTAKEGSPIHEAAKKHLEDAGIPMKDIEGLEDDVPKTGPPDPDVARRKMAEGYIWHEETRSWIMRENMKNIQGGHGAKDATMIHGGSSHGTGEGASPKPFALNEGGDSPSDNHFVVSHAGVHKVGTPSAKPTGFSSNQHTTEASLGHALKDTKVGANGAAPMPGALGGGGALANSGLATADKHIAQQPETKGVLSGISSLLVGGAMDKLKDHFGLEEIEDESALDMLLVKYK